MKMKLEAISAIEGMAIVRVGKELRLIRPPYSNSDTPTLPEGSLQDAVVKHGFCPNEKEFINWRALIAYLDEQAAAARHSSGREVPQAIDTKAVIDAAPPQIVMRFLERVEVELLPRRCFDSADEFLITLLASSAAEHNAEIRSKAIDLLKQSKSARKQFEAGVNELAAWDIRFRSLKETGMLTWSIRVAEQIQERGRVFA